MNFSVKFFVELVERIVGLYFLLGEEEDSEVTILRENR